MSDFSQMKYLTLVGPVVLHFITASFVSALSSITCPLQKRSLSKSDQKSENGAAHLQCLHQTELDKEAEQNMRERSKSVMQCVIFGIAEKNCVNTMLEPRERCVCAVLPIPVWLIDQIQCTCVCVCEREQSWKISAGFSQPPFTSESYHPFPHSPSVLTLNCSLPWKTFYLSVNSFFFPLYFSGAKVRHFISFYLLLGEVINSPLPLSFIISQFYCNSGLIFHHQC